MYGDFQNFRNFNSHAHVERDKISLSPTSVQKISTHTLTWSVTSLIPFAMPYRLDFNSHAHVERDKLRCMAELRILRDFNSHAHVERDCVCQYVNMHENYFNSHAHVERDNSRKSPIYRRLHFNSHAHVERDGQSSFVQTLKRISTHTLTWSVTFAVFTLCMIFAKFQLTRSRGA